MEEAMRTNGLKATVSGSFRRYMPAVQDAVYALTEMGIKVLSPADPRVVDQFGDFLFVASDKLRSIGLVQRRHFAAIAASDFVWLVSEDGYVGNSASAEIGYALAVGVPVYTDQAPDDLTIRQLLKVVSRMADVPLALSHPSMAAEGVLLDPVGAVEDAHRHLEVIGSSLTSVGSSNGDIAVKRSAERIRELLSY
jgi:hypothetical protein